MSIHSELPLEMHVDSFELPLDSLLSFNLDILDELINEVLTYEPLVNRIKKKQSYPICFILTGRKNQAKRSKLCNKNTKTS